MVIRKLHFATLSASLICLLAYCPNWRCGMPETWRKALGAILSVVLTVGLFPCVAWGESSQVDSGEGNITFGQTVSLGTFHSVAVKQDGSLWTWGWNDRGQLGDGTSDDHSAPAKVLDEVISISLGKHDYSGAHSAAIKEDGSLWMWGGECLW